jgi:hypothetical protein
VEVKCSQSLIDEIRRLGGDPLLYKTGHSLIKAKMKEIGRYLLEKCPVICFLLMIITATMMPYMRRPAPVNAVIPKRKSG